MMRVGVETSWLSRLKDILVNAHMLVERGRTPTLKRIKQVFIAIPAVSFNLRAGTLVQVFFLPTGDVAWLWLCSVIFHRHGGL